MKKVVLDLKKLSKESNIPVETLVRTLKNWEKSDKIKTWLKNKGIDPSKPFIMQHKPETHETVILQDTTEPYEQSRYETAKNAPFLQKQMVIRNRFMSYYKKDE